MKRGAEFSVYQGGGSSPPAARRPPRPAPDLNLNLRPRQRSLGNLTALGEGERRGSASETPHAATHRDAQTHAAPWGLGSPGPQGVRRGARARSLSLSLTKVLSPSEHSLIPVPWRRSAGGVTRPQRAPGPPPPPPPRGGGAWGEGEGGRGAEDQDGEGWAAEEEAEGGPREGRALLDQEVILTMLGDLEQVLHTHAHRARESHEHTPTSRTRMWVGNAHTHTHTPPRAGGSHAHAHTRPHTRTSHTHAHTHTHTQAHTHTHVGVEASHAHTDMHSDKLVEHLHFCTHPLAFR